MHLLDHETCLLWRGRTKKKNGCSSENVSISTIWINALPSGYMQTVFGIREHVSAEISGPKILAHETSKVGNESKEHF